MPTEDTTSNTKADGQENTDTSGVTIEQGGGAATAHIDREAYDTAQAEDGNSNDELIGGKFKSQEDLLAAYKELEQKLGQGGASSSEDNEYNQGEAEESDQSDNEGGGDYVYSEQMDEALKQAEIDPSDLAKRVDETGELSEDDYTKLEKAGFPRALVDSAVEGMKAQKQQEAAMTEAKITEIKASVGGDETFAKVQEHVASQWTQEQVNEYNEAVSSGDPSKAQEAVKKAHESYLKEIGKEGNLVGGKAPGSNAQGYTSEAEMLEDMADPRYQRSEAFREQVQRKLSQSPNLFGSR